jgi:hypothetical protein
LLAIRVKPIEPFLIVEPVDALRVLVLVRVSRLAGLVHQPFASGIFLIAELQGNRCRAQPRRQSRGQGHCLRATLLFDREDRPAKAGMQNVALYRVLEVRAVGANHPGWIGRRLNELRRDRVAGDP